MSTVILPFEGWCRLLPLNSAPSYKTLPLSNLYHSLSLPTASWKPTRPPAPRMSTTCNRTMPARSRDDTTTRCKLLRVLNKSKFGQRGADGVPPCQGSCHSPVELSLEREQSTSWPGRQYPVHRHLHIDRVISGSPARSYLPEWMLQPHLHKRPSSLGPPQPGGQTEAHAVLLLLFIELQSCTIMEHLQYPSGFWNQTMRYLQLLNEDRGILNLNLLAHIQPFWWSYPVWTFLQDPVSGSWPQFLGLVSKPSQLPCSPSTVSLAQRVVYVQGKASDAGAPPPFELHWIPP